MPSGPDLEIILTDDHPRGSSDSLSDGDDMFLTIDNLDNDFPIVERPRALVKKGSMQQEKQVSVDPMSLMGTTIRQASFKLVSTPPRAPRSPGMSLNSPLPPPKLKFVTSSLPSSTSSSPRSYTSMSKKQWEGHNMASPQPHQNWAMDDNDLSLQEYNTRKSRSEAEGRTSVSADDFNIMPSMGGGTKYDDFNNFSKPVNGFDDSQSMGGKHGDVPEDGFKCGKLCLFLPRGKGKTVRASSSKSISSMTSRMSSMPSQMSNRMPPVPSHKAESVSSNRSLKMDLPVISRRVSLERFDLTSMSPSVASDDEGDEPTSLFFDLPLEMIRYSVSEVQSPITTAFVFDKEGKMDKEPKRVVRNASPSTDARRSMSQDSSRHVRFSTSSATSPSSVSPRKSWRDDFST